jgi:hypothetical protein
MTTFQQPSATAEVTALPRLYGAGAFRQALRLLGESDLLATLEGRPDDPELTATALLVANQCEARWEERCRADAAREELPSESRHAGEDWPDEWDVQGGL